MDYEKLEISTPIGKITWGSIKETYASHERLLTMCRRFQKAMRSQDEGYPPSYLEFVNLLHEVDAAVNHAESL